jgi:hypothetical protein
MFTYYAVISDCDVGLTFGCARPWACIRLVSFISIRILRLSLEGKVVIPGCLPGLSSVLVKLVISY